MIVKSLMTFVVFLILVAVVLIGCGGEEVPPTGDTKLSLRDDATLAVEEVQIPSRGITVSCVVVTSQGTNARSVAVDCWWP